MTDSASDLPEHPPVELLGRWRLLRADPALEFAPGVRMEFRPGGELLYTIDVGGRGKVIRLVYRVAGDMLYTEHPAAAHSMTVRFAFGAGGVLVFDFSGARAWFVRDLTM